MNYGQPLDHMAFGKLDSYVPTTEAGPSADPVHKSQLNTVEGLHNASRGSRETLEENVGNTSSHIIRSRTVTETSAKATDAKETRNLWDCIKLKSFCTARETTKKTERRENIIANNTVHKK